MKIKALFLVCACVMLAGLSARKRGVLVEDWENQSLCCCCDSSGCLLWDLGLYYLLRVVVKGERWCGLVSGSNRVGCCRYEPELEVGMVCSTGLLISEFAMLLFLISL